MLNEIIQSQKDKDCVFHSSEAPGGVRFTETESTWWAPGAGAGQGRDADGDGTSSWAGKNVLKLTVVTGAQSREHRESPGLAHFRSVCRVNYLSIKPAPQVFTESACRTRGVLHTCWEAVCDQGTGVRLSTSQGDREAGRGGVWGRGQASFCHEHVTSFQREERNDKRALPSTRGAGGPVMTGQDAVQHGSWGAGNGAGAEPRQQPPARPPPH